MLLSGNSYRESLRRGHPAFRTVVPLVKEY